MHVVKRYRQDPKTLPARFACAQVACLVRCPSCAFLVCFGRTPRSCPFEGFHNLGVNFFRLTLGMRRHRNLPRLVTCLHKSESHVCAAHLLIRFLGSNVFCGSYKIPLVSESPSPTSVVVFMCCKPHGKCKRALGLRGRCGGRSCDWQPRVARGERKNAVSPEPTDTVDLTARRSERALDAESMPPNKKEIPAHSADMYETVLCTTKPRMGRSSLRSARDVVARNKSHHRFFFVFVYVDN